MMTTSTTNDITTPATPQSQTQSIMATPPLSPSTTTTTTTTTTIEDDCSPSPSDLDTPASASYPESTKARRQSTITINRKPVPCLSENDLAQAHEVIISPRLVVNREAYLDEDNDPFRTTSSTSPPLRPPPPIYTLPRMPSSHHAYILPPSYLPAAPTPEFDIGPVSSPFMLDTVHAYSSSPSGSLGVDMNNAEGLPVYAEENQTEPKTLARALWKWGFLCPFFWLVGTIVLCVPLKDEEAEEEQDPEKAQKVQEMITIIRQTELRYAKRCLYSLVGLSAIISLIVMIVLVVRAARD
ncbi:hypothetical protein IAR55_004585 [Kwoniella newhampshirensis]|uniref:Uncharacterized protein n=1 Tax=Kwoniella newhampshirensis TaxID=1651941 RepID=A0AAW0YVK1_9TREE